MRARRQSVAGACAGRPCRLYHQLPVTDCLAGPLVFVLCMGQAMLSDKETCCPKCQWESASPLWQGSTAPAIMPSDARWSCNAVKQKGVPACPPAVCVCLHRQECSPRTHHHCQD